MPHKQLVLNKREDWRTVLRLNASLSDDAIRPDGPYALVCLSALDSRENGFNWERVSLRVQLPPDSLIRTWARAADDELYNARPLETALREIENAEQAAAFMHGAFRPVGGGTDFSVAASGRYLWLMFEFLSSRERPTLNEVRVQTEGDHMIDYMPAIYRDGDDFTKRFLSVFDSIVMDLEREIYDLPSRFDYEAADGAMLDYLAGWVCVDGREVKRGDMRGRIASAISDYETMHTLEGVRRSVERLTGAEARIIESANVDPNSSGCAHSELYRRLYGDNPHKFFVLLDETVFRSRGDMEGFLERMRPLIPADTEFELIMLKKCVQLDRHCYLGLNSVVSGYVPVLIDEIMTIHYDTMIGGDRNEGV